MFSSFQSVAALTLTLLPRERVREEGKPDIHVIIQQRPAEPVSVT